MVDCFSECLSQTFTTKPSNVAGIVGLPNTLQLECAIAMDLDVKPIQYSWQASGTILFDAGTNTALHPHHDKFTLESATSQQWKNYNMLVQIDILNVVGQYLCTTTHSTTIAAYADVLLLGM